MVKTILIDDEIHCLKTLEILLKEYCPDVNLIGKYSDPQTALTAIPALKPDLVFLDIEMPHLNGFDLLERISPIDFAVIFTTGYDHYAIKAIHLSALDYLLKPVDAKELINAVRKVSERRYPPQPEQFDLLLKKIQGPGIGFNKFAVPTADGFELVAADQVLYLEANDNYTHLLLKNKRKIIACRTLKDMEAQLEEFPFFVRVHNSYIINLNEVVKYVRGDGGYLVMTDESLVNVSRSRKEALLKFF